MMTRLSIITIDRYVKYDTRIKEMALAARPDMQKYIVMVRNETLTGDKLEGELTDVFADGRVLSCCISINITIDM